MYNNENDFFQLIENNNDTNQELRMKNKKLREIIIQITSQLKALNIKYQNLEKQFTSEKQMLLDKLEQITGNYKLYAEGYQEKAILKKDMGTLLNNYKQNNKVLNSFKDSFIFLLKKNMNIYKDFKKIETFQNDNNKTFTLLNNMKNNLFSNIIRFRKNIDMINFPEFYKEYLIFIESEEKAENDNNKLFYRKTFNNTFQRKINIVNNNSHNLRKNQRIENSTNYRKKSFGKNRNKYSFTRLKIDTNINNEEEYKETNYYTNYLNQNKENKFNKKIESHKVNYLKYGKI